jgi:hypothetical protein
MHNSYFYYAEGHLVYQKENTFLKYRAEIIRTLFIHNYVNCKMSLQPTIIKHPVGINIHTLKMKKKKRLNRVLHMTK